MPRIKGDFLKKASNFKKNGVIYERIWQHAVYQAICCIVSEDISLNVEVPPVDCKFTELENLEAFSVEFARQDPILSLEEQIFRSFYFNKEFSEGEKDADDYLGFLDFYINSLIRWGIEITREGLKIEEHLSRFIPPNGKYSSMPFYDYLVLVH